MKCIEPGCRHQVPDRYDSLGNKQLKCTLCLRRLGFPAKTVHSIYGFSMQLRRVLTPIKRGAR